MICGHRRQLYDLFRESTPIFYCRISLTVEREDIIPNDYAGNMGYHSFYQPATTPGFDASPSTGYSTKSRTPHGDDVIISGFTEGRTRAQWLQPLYAKMQAKRSIARV